MHGTEQPYEILLSDLSLCFVLFTCITPINVEASPALQFKLNNPVNIFFVWHRLFDITMP